MRNFFSQTNGIELTIISQIHKLTHFGHILFGTFHAIFYIPFTRISLYTILFWMLYVYFIHTTSGNIKRVENNKSIFFMSRMNVTMWKICAY